MYLEENLKGAAWQERESRSPLLFPLADTKYRPDFRDPNPKTRSHSESRTKKGLRMPKPEPRSMVKPWS